MAKGGISLIGSLIGGGIGAALDHGNWFGTWSNIFGAIGLAGGYWLARRLDEFIDT